MAHDDAQLVERALAGDRDAFQDLVVRYQAKVLTLLTRMLRDRELALDMGQEVFFKAFRGLDKLKEPGKFGSWLMQMAHNRGLDHIKKRRPDSILTDFSDQKVEASLSPTTTNPAEDPEAIIERLSAGETLELLDDLDIKYRTILILRFMEGFPFQQIAEILDLPLSTVKFRKFYAVRVMKEKLMARRRARGEKAE